MCDKAFNVAKNPKYGGYQRALASMVLFFFFFDKKASAGTAKSEDILNKELAKELRKAVIRKFIKRKVQSHFIDNIWGADLANMQLAS